MFQSDSCFVHFCKTDHAIWEIVNLCLCFIHKVSRIFTFRSADCGHHTVHQSKHFVFVIHLICKIHNKISLTIRKISPTCILCRFDQPVGILHSCFFYIFKTCIFDWSFHFQLVYLCFDIPNDFRRRFPDSIHRCSKCFHILALTPAGDIGKRIF